MSEKRDIWRVRKGASKINNNKKKDYYLIFKKNGTVIVGV
jgi:hypothetical protein